MQRIRKCFWTNIVPSLYTHFWLSMLNDGELKLLHYGESVLENVVKIIERKYCKVHVSSRKISVVYTALRKRIKSLWYLVTKRRKKCRINVGPAINPSDVKSIFITYEHSMSWASFFVQRKQKDWFRSMLAQSCQYQ